MNEKEIKITPPEGYEIDKEHSTFGCIKFKPISQKRWRYNVEKSPVSGYYIDFFSNIGYVVNKQYTREDYNIFATEKQAKSALAMARISQIMANDERFGGVVSDEEWEVESVSKYCVSRRENKIVKENFLITYHFLAFHTAEQRDLFLEEDEDLVRDYLMLD